MNEPSGQDTLSERNRTPNGDPDRWRGWSLLVLRPLNAAAIVASVIMLVLLLVGFSEIVNGIWDYFAGPPYTQAGVSKQTVIMKTTVKSFELMLLAPLPFLMIMGLAQYLRAVTGQSESGKGRLLITEAKAMWIGLLVGVFATNLLEKALTHEIRYEESISTAIIVLLLIGYFFMLERLTRLPAGSGNAPPGR